MSLNFIDSILAALSKSGICLCDCVIAWVCDCVILGKKKFIDAALNSPAQVDTFRYWNHISSPHKSNFISKLKLDIQLQVRNTEHEMIISILRGFYELKSYHRRRGGGRGGEGIHGYISIVINLTIIFAEIINVAPNNITSNFISR